MYQDIKLLYGKKLSALDGEIGHVRDFYFDDKTWAVRYLVVDTGSWLPGRQVLLPPLAFGTKVFGKSDPDMDFLCVNLTRAQIDKSPSILSHLPVSRQYEMDYYRYYGWPGYWQGAGMGGTGFLEAAPLTIPDNPLHHIRNQPGDPHLRSTKAVTGYHIYATDGKIGSLSGFMLDGRSWAVRELVVDAGHWYDGKQILLLPANITRISYEDAAVFINLTQADIEQTTKNDVAQPAAGER